MDLDALNKIENARRKAIREAEVCETNAKAIALIRKDDRQLLDCSSIKYQDKAVETLKEAFAEHRSDLCRVAELRLSAEARQHRSQARLLQAQIDAYFETEEPVDEE